MSDVRRVEMGTDVNGTYRRQALNTCMPDGNDERRLSGVGSLDVKIGFGGRNKQTNDGDTSNVEQQDTNVNSLDGLGKVTAGVLGFTSGNLSKHTLDGED